MGKDRTDVYYWKCDRAAAFHGTDGACSLGGFVVGVAHHQDAVSPVLPETEGMFGLKGIRQGHMCASFLPVSRHAVTAGPPQRRPRRNRLFSCRGSRPQAGCPAGRAVFSGHGFHQRE